MTVKREKRRALGRGLEALLPSKPKAASAAPGKPSATASELRASKASFLCPIERIHPRSDQPRQFFDSKALDDLAATIAAHGVIQPIVVRRTRPGADDYEIIAGERRWRAAQKAGKKDVPVVVKDVTPAGAYAMALIENVQRQDLNPVEVAEAYRRLLDEHGLTQDALAQSVGKSRVAVTNSLRLLRLPKLVLGYVRDGQLSEGHGRALLALTDPKRIQEVALKALRGKLSVRKTEKLARATEAAGSSGAAGPPAATQPGQKSASVRDLERRLTHRFGTKVEVRHRGKGGDLVVKYANLDELDRILAALDA